MTDITFHLESHKFSYRVVAIIQHQNRYLLTTVPQTDFWFLPGGRVKLGETLAEALARELEEELHVSGAQSQFCWLVENFFSEAERPVHEISAFFSVTLPPDSPCLAQSEFNEAPDLSFRWFSLSEMAALDVRPSFLKTKLGTESPRFEHLAFRNQHLIAP